MQSLQERLGAAVGAVHAGRDGFGARASPAQIDGRILFASHQFTDIGLNQVI